MESLEKKKPLYCKHCGAFIDGHRLVKCKDCGKPIIYRGLIWQDIIDIVQGTNKNKKR